MNGPGLLLGPGIGPINCSPAQETATRPKIESIRNLEHFRRLSGLTPQTYKKIAQFFPSLVLAVSIRGIRFSGKSSVSMAARIAARYLSRRLSSSGKVLSEEEKAAENVFIKKMEKEKLEKLGQKGAKPDETPATHSESVPSAEPQVQQTSSTSNVSTDEDRNRAVLAGLVTLAAATGWWYLGTRKTKSEEIED